MAATKVAFYYDIVSPFSFLSWKLIQRYETIWNLDIQACPIFLGAVMKDSGNKPPLTVANKGAHMIAQDLPLCSKAYQIPYKFPSTFPLNTIPIMRFLRVVKSNESSETLKQTTNLFFDAFWGSESNAPDCLLSINWAGLLKDALSAERVKELILLSGSEENKEGVKQDAARLVAEGSFGAPWIVAQKPNGEIGKFFGADRMEVMAIFLEKEWKGFNPISSSADKAKL